jgi:hypothetical protein
MNRQLDNTDIRKLLVVLILTISFIITILITWTRVQFIYINNGPETDTLYLELIEEWEMAEMLE